MERHETYPQDTDRSFDETSTLAPSLPSTPQEEFLQVIEKSSGKTLFVPQSLPLSPHYIYEGIVIFIWDYSQVLFQVRSKTKSLFPGMYDASVTGHMTSDDHGSPILTAIREITEELEWNPLTKSTLLSLGQVDDTFLITNPKTKEEHTLTQRAHMFALQIESIEEIFTTKEQFSEEVERVIGKSIKETQALGTHIPEQYVPRKNTYQKMKEYFQSIFPENPLSPPPSAPLSKTKQVNNTLQQFRRIHGTTPLGPLFPAPEGHAEKIIPLLPEHHLSQKSTAPVQR